MSDRNVPLDGGNDDSRTSIAIEVPTLILLSLWVFKAFFILRMAGTMLYQISLGELLMTSLPTRKYRILTLG